MARPILPLAALLFAASAWLTPAADPPAKAPPLRLLFLGDSAGHKPAERFKIIQPILAGRGIALTYTDKLDDLNPTTLGRYDGLVIYANHTKIAPEQEKALLDYVASGKGFVPLHCASYCFHNSPGYIELVGAQFRSHGTGTFRTDVVKPDHPVMKGYQAFSSWDETYVHTRHNEKDRTVLEVRTDGDLKEPWTWVRTPGKSRVFYTAWGHDARTWGHPGFQNLLERGIRWACGQDPSLAGVHFDKPEMTAARKDVAPFEYTEAKIPLYLPGAKKGGGDRADKMQKPLPAAESVKHFVTPKDFEVRTFVTEEKLGGKPLAMTWDEQGRLWVSITMDYPNELKRDGEGRDRIVVCEDADGDGVCDTVTTFADRLSIPTSILPYAGGVIVTQAPHTLFLKDTDGDGKADVRQVLFTGWGTRDTHAGPSSLRYGFDNWVYGSVGYSGFDGSVNGEKHSFRQGFFRFKVEAEKPPRRDGGALSVSKLEFLRSTNNNTWGFGFDEAGRMFGSTANGCPIVHLPIPNRYYEKVKGLTPSVLQNIAPDFHFEPITDKVRQVDWHHGFTAAAGLTVYTARTYPTEYWNRTAFISDPTGHLTAAFTLHPDGADYKARYGWNLLASDDEWSAPIQAEVGPDGHMWVIDWYNFIVQHNPTPAGFRTGAGNAYETDLRDKTHGRIYRVVYTKAKPEPRVNLKGATPEKLVETLKHHNMTWRLHAQRLLVERGKTDIAKELFGWFFPNTPRSDDDPSADLTHALWTLSGLGHFSSPTSVLQLRASLEHSSPSVRYAAAQVLAEELRKKSEATQNTLLASASILNRDTLQSTRLVKFLAISELPPSKQAAFSLVEMLLASGSGTNARWSSQLDEIDRTQWDAVVMAASVQDLHFLKSYLFVSNVAGKPPVRTGALVESVAKQYAARAPQDISEIFTAQRLEAAPFAPVLAGLAAGWPSGKPVKLTPAAEESLLKLLPELAAAPRSQLLRLAQAWGVKGIDEQIAVIAKAASATIADAKATDDARLDAAKQLIEFRPDDDAAPAQILAAVSAQSSPAFAGGIFDALSASKSKALGSAVLAKLKDVPPSARPAALRLVLGRVESTKAFLDAVEAGKVRFDMLALDQRAALAAHPDKAVAERAKKLLALGGGLPNADRQKVVEEYISAVKKTGSVEAGKKLFTQHCAKCHKYAGEGTQIGPDLTGMAVHPKEELLIHILDPSRSVEGNFKAYRVTTADGRVLIGLLASESKTSVEVVDAEAKRFPLQRDAIEALVETDKSLMPEGFEKQMKVDEMADLLEFLTQKGKFVPLPLDKVATVVSTKGMFIDESGPEQRLIFPDWKPKTFNGIPFVLVDPQGDKVKNVVLLNGPNGRVSAAMPKSVTLPYSGKAKEIHLLSGVGGWNAQAPANGRAVSMIVRLTYADGTTEDHPLRDGVHFADYIRRIDVPGSQFAFALRSQQIRYLAVTPKRPDADLKAIEFVKGPDRSAPVVMAATVETP